MDARRTTETEGQAILIGFENARLRVILSFVGFMIAAKAMLIQCYLWQYPWWNGWLTTDTWVRGLVDAWVMLPMTVGAGVLWVWSLWRKVTVRDAAGLCAVMTVAVIIHSALGPPLFWPYEHASSTRSACWALVLGPVVLSAARLVTRRRLAA